MQSQEGLVPLPLKVTLGSSSLINIVGMWDFWQNMIRSGDRRLVIGQIISAYPTMPGAMVYDWVDGRLIPVIDEKAETLTLEWEGPMGKAEDYLHDWRTAYFNIGGLRLEWLQEMLTQRGVAWRMHKLEGRAREVLQVPSEKAVEADKLLRARIIDTPVDKLGDNDIVFQEGGIAWELDNVDELP